MLGMMKILVRVDVLSTGHTLVKFLPLQSLACLRKIQHKCSGEATNGKKREMLSYLEDKLLRYITG